MSTVTQTREDLLETVAGLRAEFDRWETVADDLAWEADRTRSEMGETVLRDADSGATIGASIRAIEDRAQAAQQAARAVEPKLAAARRAVLECDADDLDAQADELETQLTQHHVKTSRILAQLLKHEGVFAPEKEMVSLDGTTAVVRVGVLKSETLDVQIQRTRLRANALRDLAAGHDPVAQVYPHDPGLNGRLTKARDAVTGLVLGLEPTEYFPPAVWGPGAVAPAPAFKRRVEGVRSHLAQHDVDTAGIEATLEDKRSRLAKLKAEINRRRADPIPTRREPTTEESSKLAGLNGLIRDLEAQRESAPARRTEIVVELETLTGEGPELSG